MSKGYAVTLEGMYMVDGGHGRKSEKKAYKVIVNVPKYSDNTLSLIKNRLLESAIRKFDPNYKTYLTHSITGVQPIGEAGEEEELPNRLLKVKNMSIAQLTNYVRGNKLPVALHLYTASILDFRKAIESCEADCKKFLAKQSKLQEDYEVQKELQDLNPGLETSGDVKLNTCEPVSLPRDIKEEEFMANLANKVEHPGEGNEDADFIRKATEEAAKPETKVAQEEPEEYLTNGSESFSRASEAPFPDDIDDEIPNDEKEVDVDAILAANEPKHVYESREMTSKEAVEFFGKKEPSEDDLVGDL